jgi:hypothetical protein
LQPEGLPFDSRGCKPREDTATVTNPEGFHSLWGLLDKGIRPFQGCSFGFSFPGTQDFILGYGIAALQAAWEDAALRRTNHTDCAALLMGKGQG